MYPVTPAVEWRAGGAADLPQLCVLATCVFVHTYCAGGLRPDQAREALSVYSVAEFERRLAHGHRYVLAGRGEHLLGFAETAVPAEVPVPAVAGALELTRLYVDPSVQGQGIGRALLRQAEAAARARGCTGLWLTAWVDNAEARGFYGAAGYEDVGRCEYVFEDRAYENRIYLRSLPG